MCTLYGNHPTESKFNIEITTPVSAAFFLPRGVLLHLADHASRRGVWEGKGLSGVNPPEEDMLSFYRPYWSSERRGLWWNLADDGDQLERPRVTFHCRYGSC